MLVWRGRWDYAVGEVEAWGSLTSQREGSCHMESVTRRGGRNGVLQRLGWNRSTVQWSVTSDSFSSRSGVRPGICPVRIAAALLSAEK